MLRFKSNICLLLLIICLLVSCSSSGRKQNKSRTYRYKNTNQKAVRKEQKHRSVGKITGKLDKLIEKYWGAKYKYGATGPGTFDCSGFVQRIFREAYALKLPRSSRKQYKTGTYVKKKYLKYGDLVFFNTSGRGVSHVGVYIGNDKFSHASSSKGITISNLNNSYYLKRYLGARRVL